MRIRINKFTERVVLRRLVHIIILLMTDLTLIEDDLSFQRERYVFPCET